MKNYIKLMRVKHYLKNFLIFLPLLFSGKFLESNNLLDIIIAFISFSLAASSIYIINDIKDVENDKKHVTKCNRPIASGKITIKNAVILLIILLLLCLALNIYIAGINIWIWLALIIYIVSNLAYSLGLKNVALLDVFLLVLGYLVRVYYGALIIDVNVSSWLYLTILSMAFFMGLGKRRNEMVKNGVKSRKVLIQYNKEFLDKNMYIFLSLTIIFYSLWCETMVSLLHNSWILITVPLLIAICMKYSLNIEGESDGDPIEVLLNDKILILLAIVYVCFIGLILYSGKLINLVR